MTESSIHSQLCDLIGHDPFDDEESRPTVRQAAASVGHGQVAAARIGTRKFCVVRLKDGRAFALPDRCPHDGGLLSDGFIEENRLVCARHGWEFDLDNGTCPMRSEVCLDVVALDVDRN